MKKELILIGLLTSAISTLSFGQSFKYEAKTSKVAQKGFYNIVLTPEVTSHLKDNFADVRLYDEQGKEIPYLLRSEQPLIQKELFKEYVIAENTHIKNCCTKLILQNAAKNKINNVSLVIKNSDARKKGKLSGSNDKANWYIIKDEFLLDPILSNTQTYEVKILDFALSDYEYYQLEIKDSTSAPLNIVKAGYYDTYSEDGKYLELPSANLFQKDSSDKSTYVRISFPQKEFIDRLKVTITDPALYYRKAKLCEKTTYKSKIDFVPITYFDLHSGSSNLISLDHIKAKELYLIIENNDNAPLKIGKVEGSLLMHYITANLDANKEYFVKFGNEKIDYPQYDLEYFKDSIPNNVASIYPQVLKMKEEKRVAEKSFFNSNTWIWVAIVLVIALLAFMTRSMLKEMKNQPMEKQDSQ